MPIAWKITAATPQIKVQSVRLIGLPRPTAGWWSSRLGGLRRVALAVAVRLHLGEVGGVGPGGRPPAGRWPARRGRRRPSAPRAGRAGPGSSGAARP